MLTGDMLRRSANRFPHKPAILWEGHTLSYHELNASANRLANTLIAAGFGKGTKIGIISRNRTEYGIVFFGVSKSGCVLVNVSVLYAPDELSFVLDKADIELLFVEDLFAGKVEAVKDQLPKLREVVIIGGDGDAFTAFLADGNVEEPEIDLSEDDPFCMTYTGGTTGRPKGVLCSHRARATTAHTVMVEEALDERDVIGVVTPMFHVAALNIMFQPAILTGATVTMLSKWDPVVFREMVRDTGMTATFFVPTQALMLVQDPGFKVDDYKSWRKVSFAGAPMPDWVQRELMAKLPNLRLTQIYGQSEMGVIAVLPHWMLPVKLGAVGRESYNTDTRVVRPDGINVEPNGEIGEVICRGDSLMSEYYKEPKQTEAFFRLGDDWGWSGDLATIDMDGYIYLVDRSKDMMISGGENVYPSEIEAAIFELPAVSECAVFGIPDDKWGEVPAAYVVLKTGTSLSEDDVIKHCASKLARFKRPRLVKFVDDFPKTPIGKIQKTKLRASYWEDQDSQVRSSPGESHTMA